MNKNYEEELKRLEHMPRAERFNHLIQFPVEHSFKAIGRAKGFSQEVEKLLKAEGYGQPLLIEQFSAKGTYLSVSFTLKVENGEELDQIYLALEKLPGLAYLL